MTDPLPDELSEAERAQRALIRRRGNGWISSTVSTPRSSDSKHGNFTLLTRDRFSGGMSTCQWRSR